MTEVLILMHEESVLRVSSDTCDRVMYAHMQQDCLQRGYTKLEPFSKGKTSYTAHYVHESAPDVAWGATGESVTLLYRVEVHKIANQR